MPVTTGVDPHSNNEVSAITLPGDDQAMRVLPDATSAPTDAVPSAPGATDSPPFASPGSLSTANARPTVTPLSALAPHTDLAGVQTPAAGPGLIQLLSMAQRSSPRPDSSAEEGAGRTDAAENRTLRSAVGTILSYSPDHRTYDRASSRLGLRTPPPLTHATPAALVAGHRLGIQTTAGAPAAAAAVTSSPDIPAAGHGKVQDGESVGSESISHRANSPAIAEELVAIAQELAAIAQDEQLQQRDHERDTTPGVPEGDPSTCARRI